MNKWHCYFRHLAIVSSLCVLSILTGVYCAVSSETSVKIVIYVPSHYSYKNATIYSSLYKTVDLVEDRRGEMGGIKWFGKLLLHYINISIRCNLHRFFDAEMRNKNIQLKNCDSFLIFAQNKD